MSGTVLGLSGRPCEGYAWSAYAASRPSCELVAAFISSFLRRLAGDVLVARFHVSSDGRVHKWAHSVTNTPQAAAQVRLASVWVFKMIKLAASFVALIAFVPYVTAQQVVWGQCEFNSSVA